VVLKYAILSIKISSILLVSSHSLKKIGKGALMARDDDDEDGLPPLGEGTEGYLEDAKKGKPRCFLLVCKGAKVKYLKVKKKSVKKNEIAEAKKLGYKGDAYIGILNGKGMDLVFNLAISDGYESAPVKDKTLKDFLEEHANVKCKPSFSIVATPPEVPFDDEDLQHPLVAQFLELAEQIPQVLDINPGAEAELKQTNSEIRTLLQDGEFNVAEPRVQSLQRRLEELRNPTGKNPLEELVKGLLSTLPGDLQRLRIEDSVTADKIQKIVDAGSTYGQKGDFQNAYKYLEQASQVLAKALTSGRTKQAGEVIPEGIVSAMKASLGKAQTRWEQALNAARQRLKPVQDSVANEYPSLAQGLKNILDSYEEDLRQKLTQGQSKALEQELTVAVRETIEKVQSLRNEAEADLVFAYLEECSIPVRAAVSEALDDVQEILLS
jgi:hypothetical protein